MRICPECEQQTQERTCPQCRVGTVPESAVTAASDPMIGERIGHQYEITEIIGRGGMGVVYRGIQLSMDRPVALKVISPSLARDLQVVKRFQREAKLTSKLQHPNSIRVYDFGLTEDGVPYLVMELLDGKELVAEMRAVRQMSVERAVSITTQVLKALHEAHGLGIVHRDLKPANIFLQRMAGEDLVKVMDFGIAKVVRGEGESSNQNLTQTGLLVGTPQYMSPEQIKGGTIDQRSDLYSLGVILFQMLAGQVPFTSESPVAVMMMHTSDPPPPIKQFRPDLANNAALQDVLDRFLAKHPKDRPVSALHAISLLQRVAPASVEVSGTEVLALDTAGFRRLEDERQRSVPNPMTPLPDGSMPPATANPTAEVPKTAALSPDEAALVLKNTASPAPLAETRLVPPQRSATPASAPAPAPTDDAVDEDDDEELVVRGSRMGLVMAVAGVLGAAAAGITFMVIRGNAKPTVVVQTRQPVAATADPAAEVTLTLRSTPEGATVIVNGQKVGVTPMEHRIPNGDKALPVRMELAGHVAQDSEVVPDGSRTVELTLAAEPKTAGADDDKKPEPKKAAADDDKKPEPKKAAASDDKKPEPKKAAADDDKKPEPKKAAADDDKKPAPKKTVRKSEPKKATRPAPAPKKKTNDIDLLEDL